MLLGWAGDIGQRVPFSAAKEDSIAVSRIVDQQLKRVATVTDLAKVGEDV